MAGIRNSVLFYTYQCTDTVCIILKKRLDLHCDDKLWDDGLKTDDRR